MVMELRKSSSKIQKCMTDLKMQGMQCIGPMVNGEWSINEKPKRFEIFTEGIRQSYLLSW
jgi:hypothetical protein